MKIDLTELRDRASRLSRRLRVCDICPRKCASVAPSMNRPDFDAQKPFSPTDATDE